jgi:hypothetical protein
MTRLVQMRLVSLGENNAKWGFGRVYLSPLGQLLARWTVDSNP